MKNERTGRKFRRLLIALGIGILLAGCAGAASAEEARNIAAECSYRFQRGSYRNVQEMYDGTYNHFWESSKTRDPWLEVTLPEGELCYGVQIKWAVASSRWFIEVEQDGEWVRAAEADGAYLTTWSALPGAAKFRVASSFNYPNCMKILEIEVYTDGEIPAAVQRWEPTVEKADLLMVVAHPDDEYVFLGALIPYYGAEKGKNVLVCYITESEMCRRTELLDGLWTAGQRTYPLIGKFYDRYTMDLATAYKKVGKKKVREYMIEVFRHYRPDVVVTHDIHGEYGHQKNTAPGRCRNAISTCTGRRRTRSGSTGRARSWKPSAGNPPGRSRMRRSGATCPSTPRGSMRSIRTVRMIPRSSACTARRSGKTGNTATSLKTSRERRDPPPTPWMNDPDSESEYDPDDS